MSIALGATGPQEQEVFSLGKCSDFAVKIIPRGVLLIAPSGDLYSYDRHKLQKLFEQTRWTTFKAPVEDLSYPKQFWELLQKEDGIVLATIDAIRKTLDRRSSFLEEHAQSDGRGYQDTYTVETDIAYFLTDINNWALALAHRNS